MRFGQSYCHLGQPWGIRVNTSNCSSKNRGPFHERFFHCNSNSMENQFQCNSTAEYRIVIKFCTCHDSTAVLPCAKFHSDQFVSTWMNAEWTFHRIWITMEKSFVKSVTDPINKIEHSETKPCTNLMGFYRILGFSFIRMAQMWYDSFSFFIWKFCYEAIICTEPA